MNTLELAESSTVGSLLLRPEGLAALRPWLRSHDFADPWNQQLYRHMQERSVAREPLTVEAVGLSLAERVGHRRADLPRLISLLRVTPQPRAEVYGCMVLEMSLRREVGLQGVLLRACALSAALSQSARAVAVGADMVDQALREGERRWQLASGESSSPSATHPKLAPALRNLDRYLASDKFLAAHPETTVEQVREDERATVAALIRHPAQLSEIRTWMRPELLTDPSWKAAYEALLAVVEAGVPADAVTISWQLQRNSNHQPPGPSPLQLVCAVDDALNFDPGFFARRVATHALRRTADASARLLDSAAGNLGLAVPELYATGAVATSALRAAAEPLDHRSRCGHLQVVPVTQERRQVASQAAG
jgi:replicative DNA helicase